MGDDNIGSGEFFWVALNRVLNIQDLSAVAEATFAFVEKKALIDLNGSHGVTLAHISIFKCLPARIEPEWGYGDICLVWNFFHIECKALNRVLNIQVLGLGCVRQTIQWDRKLLLLIIFRQVLICLKSGWVSRYDD